MTPTEWDKEANDRALERYAREAAANGAKLIVTPEGFLEGYVGNENKNPELARELDVYLSVGFADRRGEAMFNSTAMIDPEGEVALHYSKSHTAHVLAVKGAQLLLVPAWGSYNELNDALMRTRAFENGVWVAFVHPKRTLIVDARGKVVAQYEGGLWRDRDG